MSLSFSYLYGFLLVLLVVEARDKQRGAPQVVERWGDLESSKCVMAVSMIDRESHPVCIGNFFFCSGSVYCLRGFKLRLWSRWGEPENLCIAGKCSRN